MLKSVNPSAVLKLIPKSEAGAQKPTTIYYGPLSKRDYDSYIRSLATVTGKKVTVQTEKAAEMLFTKCLRQGPAGYFIENVIDEKGQELAGIPVLKDAVNFLLSCQDVETVNEIEATFRGESTLDEDDEGN